MKNLAISFSGGKTSAFMTKWLLDNKRDEYDNIVVTFANTGQERDETLEFVNQCDKEFGFDTVWLEAVVNPERGKGTRHKIVDFETADRTGVTFKKMIEKFGIPNAAYLHCTRELKLSPMKSYLNSIGWKKGEYVTAIGIRADEMDRVSSKMVEQSLIYPLCEDIRVRKQDIANWWGKQSFNLPLREHEGNCSWCYKKSKRKLLTLAQDRPELCDFPKHMEKTQGLSGHNVDGTKRKFFRNNKSAEDILSLSTKPFNRWEEDMQIDIASFDQDLDAPNGCSESCEVY